MAKNIVLLYGQQACDHFDKLLSNLNLLFGPRDWQHCCFVLVTNNANIAASVPYGVAPFVQNRIVTLPTANLANASNAVFDFVQQAVTGGSPVMLYCICTDSGSGNLDGTALNTFVNGLAVHYIGDLNPVFFSLITSNVNAQQSQHTFHSELSDNGLDQKASFYLLSDTAVDNDRVDLAAQWSALDNELGRNLLRMDTMPGKVYSLGYVALNPDRRELTSIQERTLLDQIIQPYMDQRRNDDPAATIWRLLSNNHPNFPTRGDATSKTIIINWIESVIGNSFALPNEEKCKNNRVLGAVYEGELDPQRFSRHILRFYQMNISTEQFEEKAEAYFKEKYDRMLSDLASLYLDNRAKLMVDWLCEALNAIAKAPLAEFVPPAADAKTIFERESHYRDRYCENIEKKAKEYCYRETIRKMAAIMCQKLERFQDFCSNRPTVLLPFEDRVISPIQYGLLQTKYQNYCAEVLNFVIAHQGEFHNALLGLRTPMFRADGSIETESWHYVIDVLLDKLTERLNDSRTYLQVVSAQHATVPAFTTFLNTFLGATSRMLVYNAGNIIEETRYFIDDDLQNHPWSKGQAAATILILDNDNVERVDRYTLNCQTISALLTINNATFPYFWAHKNQINDNGAVGQGMILQPVNIDIPGQNKVDSEQAAAQQNATQNATNNNHYDMGISLLRHSANNQCAVDWRWPPRTTNLILTIWQNGQSVVGPIPVVAPTSRYVVPNLPYGQIKIVIEGNDTNGLYYRDDATLAGQQDRIHFNMINTDHQMVRINYTGQTPYIDEVLIQNTAPDGSITVYPIAGCTTGTFDKLVLHGNTRAIINPRLQYPRVRIV